MRRLPDLLTRGGHAVLCLNAPELETGFLQEQMHVQAPDLHFEQRLPNPPGCRHRTRACAQSAGLSRAGLSVRLQGAAAVPFT